MDNYSKNELDLYLEIINKKSKLCEQIALNYEDEEPEKFKNSIIFNKSILTVKKRSDKQIDLVLNNKLISKEFEG